MKKYFLFVTLIISLFFIFPSCSRQQEDPDAQTAAVQTVKYIGDSDEQSQNSLFTTAKPFKDAFNLTLSHNNYFYTDTIYVTVSCDIDGAEIFYTLDGSAPSKQNGAPYTGEFIFEESNSNKGSVLKLKAYSGERESQVLTHTYFVNAEIAERFDAYVFSISANPDDLFGYDNGILVAGRLRDEWQANHRRQNPVPPDPANFNLRGMEGERAAYIEVMLPTGECIISQGAGVRVHGGWSRAANKKSLALYARDSYDPNFNMFNYSFFDGRRRNDEYGTFIHDYSCLLLRNGANDREGAFIREELSQSLAEQSGIIDYHEAEPAAVFLNGEYYGFFWLKNFYNHKYFRDTYDAPDKDAIEIVELNEPKPVDLKNDETFEEFKKVLDIDNYMHYYAMQIYVNNHDWPHNNKKTWRYIGENGLDINKYFDGRYRMLYYDSEMAWNMTGSYRDRTIQRVMTNGSSPTLVALTKRGDMVEKFCNQMFDLMNTVYAYANVESALSGLDALYRHEIERSIRDRTISRRYSVKTLESSQASILRFAEKRAENIIRDMSLTFKIGNTDTYNVSVTGNENATVKLNTLTLTGEGTLKSSYFTAHSVTVSAEAGIGYEFDYWEINGTKYSDQSMKINNSFGADVNIKVFIKKSEAKGDIVIKQVRFTDDGGKIILFNPWQSEIVYDDLYISNDKTNLKKLSVGKADFLPHSVLTLDFPVGQDETIYISDRNGKIIFSLLMPHYALNGETLTLQLDGSYRMEK